jgi:transcriptional regulator with XRE-family HTH domain
MEIGEVQIRLAVLREGQMWTQGRLAEEAGVSPTTVSGIESGRISRPHFGTIRKLAEALGVDPRELLSPQDPETQPRAAASLSLAWAISSREEEFEEGLEGATLGGLLALSQRLVEEQERLRKLYGEARGAEQRRSIKVRIRGVAAQHGSVGTSIAYHPDLEASPEERNPGE